MTYLNFPILLITWEIKEILFQTMWKQYTLVLVTFLPRSKIMGSLTSGLENITEFKCQVNGFCKTALVESARYTSRILALHNPKLPQLSAIYSFLIYFFYQLSRNYYFIYLFIYILYGWLELVLYFGIELFFCCNIFVFLFLFS